MGRTYQDVCEKLIRQARNDKDRKRIERDLRTLERKSVNSFESLREVLLTPKSPIFCTATDLMELFEKPKAVPVLLHLFHSNDLSICFEAAKKLSYIRGKLAVNGCVKLLSQITEPEYREAVVYALSFMHGQKEPIPMLLQLFTDEQESIRVRTQAAEGLGNLLSFANRRRRDYQQAGEALLEGLSHAAPEIRFWSAFGLWAMRYKNALSKLEELAESDKTMCPGWWTVGEEAYDAAFSIRTGRWSGIDRIPVPITQN
jgi:HEAT repeat protein